MNKEKQSVIVSRLFGILIKRKRRELNYSKEELSFLLHIKPSLLEKWELGKSPIPKDKLSTLSSILGISNNEIDLIYKAPSTKSNRFNILYRRSFIINLIAVCLIVLCASIILSSLIFINLVNDIPRGRILVFTLFSDQYSYFFFVGISKKILMISIILISINVIIETICMLKRNLTFKNEGKGTNKLMGLLVLLSSILALKMPLNETGEVNRTTYSARSSHSISNDNNQEETYDLFYSITMNECWYECAQRFSLKAPTLFAIRQEAKLLSVSYYGDDSSLDEDSDSFRTLYIASMINYYYGERFFNRFLDTFKIYKGSDLFQINRETMDVYNARSGIRICEEFKKYQDQLSGIVYLDMGEFCTYVISQGEKYKIYKLNEDSTSFIYTSIGKDNPLFK